MPKTLKVLPYLTDNNWESPFWHLYANLLKIHRRTICTDTDSQTGKVHATLDKKWDLFLDPDTGIMTGKKAKRQHIPPKELEDFLLERNRLIIVYQHGWRKKGGLDSRIKDIKRFLKSYHNDIHLFVVVSKASNSMLIFICRNGKRLVKVHKQFLKLFGPEISKERLNPNVRASLKL